ncbi:aspartate/tyrosine/aromatic aminotransferase [Halovivax ruber XH-70]|uniref:Aspartate/tyrosine/aromatic aminotransferase n=1 Tax=Halovivax ruber (strain DSM 18193 / JCM 13892 / XH-70) TaxID=797302 RepID=L0IDH7_HALRX|nr:aminotransferase class I/II-fold pyridoxal phosphate-dependent enzyme [Halovivax ruber]AGB16794.1 aspartate/tyrosine/aromatic aminotransferase [Halovivax ruber XH-70]
MQIAPFGLERWFDRYEHDADIMLAESGIRSLSADRFDTDPGELGYVIPTDGDPEFRADVAARYDRTADECCFTCGTQEANFLAFLGLLDADGPGDGGSDDAAVTGSGEHAVVVTPTYQALHAVPEAVGSVTRVTLEPPEWELDVDAVAEAVTDETAVVVCNNPNNPTGRYHPQSIVDDVAEIAADNDAYLLCDEVYRRLADDPLEPVAARYDHGISTTSLTKAYGLAGTRFGWLVGPEPVVEAAVRWKDYTTISPSIFGQHVAKQALGEHEDEILVENRALATENHAIVREFLDDHDLEWYDPVGVNGFVTVPDGFTDGTDFCRTVVEDEGVVLAPGEYFGHPEYFRIGFGLPTDELREGLERVGRVIE